MSIEPDTKDWTWVLRERCPECSENVSEIEPADLPRLIGDSVSIWAAVLDRPDVRERPAPTVWSPLEYGCHARDVYVVFDGRLALMLDGDDPLFDNWDQDATAVASRYDLQDPATVAAELRAAAGAIATRFDRVASEQWQRTGRRSDGAVFDVAGLGRYLIHDVLHHLYDVAAPRPA